MTLFQKTDAWLSAQTADEILLMNIENGAFLSLNPMGSQLWGWMDAPVSPSSLVARLVQEFDVEDATAQADVDAFLTDLEQRGIVAKVSG